MTIDKVDEIPKIKPFTKCTVKADVSVSARKTPKSNFSAMRRRVNTIMDANVKYGKITFTSDEYVTTHVARNSLNGHATSYKLPIEFVVRDGELYFNRLDMEDSKNDC